MVKLIIPVTIVSILAISIAGYAYVTKEVAPSPKMSYDTRYMLRDPGPLVEDDATVIKDDQIASDPDRGTAQATESETVPVSARTTSRTKTPTVTQPAAVDDLSQIMSEIDADLNLESIDSLLE